MSKLVLIGGGGHCKSVLDSAQRMGIYEEIVIVDPGLSQETKILNCRIAGTDDVLPELRQNGFNFAFITVGSLKTATLRIKLAKKAEALGFMFPLIIDPTASVSSHSHLGAGTFVGRNVIVNANSQIGKHCILNTGSIIEHECQVDDFTHVSVGAILCGNVCIGRNGLIGAGSTVIQGLNIGNDVVVGANSTVLINVEDNMTVYGVVNRPGGAIQYLK